MVSNSDVFLPTGQVMPILGFGTWRVSLEKNSYYNSNKKENNNIDL